MFREKNNMHETYSSVVAEVKEGQDVATVTEISSLGYGNQESKISYDKQRENGELPETVSTKSVEIIKNNECLQPVNESDDGCIDGRPTIEVLCVDKTGELTSSSVGDNTAHERAKVAGGGYMTSLAMQRALEEPNMTLDEDLGVVASKLTEKRIYCGAHSGAHSSTEACTTDCGANDKFQKILENGVGYRGSIAENVRGLLAVADINFDDQVFNAVMDGWSKTLDNGAYFEGSTGDSRFTVIENSMKDAQEKSGSFERPVAVSKHLEGDHKESFIVLNYIEGKTFSQVQFAKKLAESFPDIDKKDLPQAFVVDVPRIVQLAKAMGAASTEDGRIRSDLEIEARTEKALYAGIAYQLATAATLTDGSLRNFVIK